jgi:hypothetical protein
VAHEEGNLNSFAAVLGNDVAIKAYREGELPFPDGTIIAALHYSHVSSEENNKVFGRSQSFVPGALTNIQFMVKDSKKYAATGGWGFGHFNDGNPGDEAFMKTCFPCHNQAKARDLVFTRYAPRYGASQQIGVRYEESRVLDYRHGPHRWTRRGRLRNRRRRPNA